MSKLSDAGKFYLADFKILQTVKDELDKFLDEIKKKVIENLQTDVIEPTKNKYDKLGFWGETKVGYFNLSFLKKYTSRDYKDGKVDIDYKDPRQLDEYDKTEIIEIKVYINSTRKPFEREFKTINDKVLEPPKVFEIDLNDSENTVNLICEFISEKFYQIDKVFDILKDKK